MTALEKYERLETIGHWRSHDTDPGREVVVKFGKSTLVLEERADAPLVHWSLPALRLRRESEGGAVYAPDYESDETLTVADPEMRAALARVMAARLDAPRRPARLRGPLYFGVVVGFLALVLLALGLPGVLGSLAPSLIPPERARLLASQMLPLIAERTGPVCATRAGNAALERLARRLVPDAAARVLVADTGDMPYLALPGHTVIVSRHVAERARSAEEFAGWTALAFADGADEAALAHVFRASGLANGVRFLANGEFSRGTLDAAVSRLLLSSDVRRPLPTGAASAILDEAGVPVGPLLAGIDREGQEPGPLTIPPAEGSDGGPLVMSEGDWAALRAICDG